MRSAHFQRLVDQNPASELFRFSLAQALAAEGRADEAMPHFEFCVRQKADWMVPRILLGRLLVEGGRKAEARPLLEEALRLAIEQQHEDPEREIRALLAEL
ncbi:MAG: molecular chaperone DnaJ [Verrucomicrobia bacterium RIFCSPLOWO2_12_FULL_64_8]|nr:MAG: molecular chaperone DnaJ [Verrucomicrobia bacterium RIFCSPLOWO2_12_FULL_64_8]